MDIMMRSVILRILLTVIFFSAIVLPSCGDENPQAPDEEIPALDTIPPAAVTGLTLRSPTTSAIALVWIAPGDDGTEGQAKAYDIRYATSAITEQSWASAAPVVNPPEPRPAGQLETVVVPGLYSVTRYYFALKTSDEVLNVSAISNCPDTTTLQEYTPPMKVVDLKGVSISDNEVLLTWTAPGDDGAAGKAAQYDIRYSYWSLNDQNWESAVRLAGEPAPKAGGEPDSFIVPGFPPDSSFYFGLKTADEVPNWSDLSNVSLVLAYEVYLKVLPTVVPEGGEVKIYFKTSTAKVTLRVWRLGFYNNDVLFRTLVDDFYSPGVYDMDWDLTSDSGSPATSWNYYVELLWGGQVIATVDLRVVY